jgi:oligopeptide transport system substrate-binding protein
MRSVRKLPDSTLVAVFCVVTLVAVAVLCFVAVLPVLPLGQHGDQLPEDTSVLRLYDVGPITLDPAVSGEMSSHIYVVHLYSGLLSLNEDLMAEPDIAKSWTVSDDGTRYVFELRDDVRFHSGKAVTASDFKYSWERACNPSTGSRTAAIYLGDIVGARDVLEGRAVELRGVTVLDEYTLQVDIEAPRSYFVDKLTYPTSFVVDSNTVARGADWWRQPNGTGPFNLSRWEPGSLLVLRRNPDYYGTRPLVDAVQFLLLAGVPMSLYERGDIDVVGVSSSYIEQVTDPSNPLHLELLSTPELSLYYIGFDVTKPPFDDLYVRLAFCHAVDRERIVTVLFKDSVGVAGGVLPAGLPGYDPDMLPYEFDPALARELLAKSSYGSAEALPPITITISGYANQVPGYIAAAMLGWKQNLGVEVSVRQLEPEVFLYYLEDERDEAFAMGWVADYPSPHNFLGTLFSIGESYNISGYSNPELEDLLARAAAESDVELSLELYRHAERVVVDDAPCLPLIYGSNQVLVKPYVSGFVPNPLGVPDLTVVSVDRP